MREESDADFLDRLRYTEHAHEPLKEADRERLLSLADSGAAARREPGMTNSVTIPPESLEAAGKAEYYARFGGGAGPWDEAPDWIKHQCRSHARAACLAMLEAWPGAYGNGPRKQWEHYTPAIILPLTETSE